MIDNKILHFKSARMDILAETVPLFVPHIAKLVDTQTVIVAVPLVIQGTDATHVNFNKYSSVCVSIYVVLNDHFSALSALSFP